MPLFGFGKKKYPKPCVMGDESIMSPKAHGTSEVSLLRSTVRYQSHFLPLFAYFSHTFAFSLATTRFRSSRIFAGNAAETRPIASAIGTATTPSTTVISKIRHLLRTPRRKLVKSNSTTPIPENYSLPHPRDGVWKTFSRRVGTTAGLVSEVR
jgi:hypothetical protein